MSEIKMLPLPEWCYADKHLHAGSASIRKKVRSHARAVAEHNVAARDAQIAQLEKANEQLHAHGERMHAEVERLRASEKAIVAEAMQYADKSGRLEARAERLAGTLRWYAEQAEGCRKNGSIGEPFRKALDRDGGGRARAALRKHDQEDEK